MSEFIKKLKQIWWSVFHREEALTRRAAIRSGISLQNDTVEFSGTGRIKHALTNAALMFGLVAGTTAAFSGAFDIDYNRPVLFSLYALCAVLLSCMNCRKLWQNIGYLLFFVLFTFFLVSYRQFINSGLNGVLNEFFEYVSDAWNMEATKTYNEAFEEQHYMTVTMFFLTVGMAVMLLINFVFNNEQSPLTVLILIFPFLQFGLYFDETPGILSFILIAVALLCCFAFRHNHQFIMPMGKKTVFRRHLRHQHLYVHYSSGRIMAQVAAVILGFILAFSSLVSILYPAGSYAAPKALTSMKDNTIPTVRQFLLYGLRSFFENEDAGIGGLSEGALGQAGTVTSDFQTDLIVTFAPYAYETVYLKSWVGTTYTGNSWENIFTENTSSAMWSDIYAYYDETALAQMNAEALLLEKLHETDSSVLKGKMLIKPEDPLFAFNYIAAPYYTLFSEDEYSTSGYSLSRVPYYTGSSFEKAVEYYVYQDIWNSDYADLPITTEYDRFVHENYLSVYGIIGVSAPTVLSGDFNWLMDRHHVAEQLKNLCDTQGFGGTTQEIIAQIQSFFAENYTYSLNPGKLPDGKDFVTYFLFENPYGYCSYFATAGTLLLRSMGIPARYAEGYVVSMNDVVDSTILEDENYDDWLEGDAAIGRTAVVQAEVNDSEAHAWCEVYLNGFGWVPVEFTPPSDDNNEDDTDYWRLWSQFAPDAADDNNNALAAIMGTNVSFILTVIGRILLAVLLVAAAVFAIHFYRRYRNNAFGKTSLYSGYSIPILKQYQKLCRLTALLGLSDTDNLVPAELQHILQPVCTTKNVSCGDLSELISLYRDAAYAAEPTAEAAYRRWKTLYRPLRSCLLERLPLHKRLPAILHF